MITRRRLISGTALGAGAGVLLPGCQQMAPKTDGKRLIVDAQVHMWTANTPALPWAPGTTPQLPEPFDIERVVPMMDEAGVDRVVIVPSANIRDDYGLEAARRYPNRFAVMGRLPLDDPKSAELLPAWKARPGMLGIRASFFSAEAQAWLVNGKVD
jgi:predicted TIM-barrel fold metal-dependent hydrolase